jgi:hypothetical protein
MQRLMSKYVNVIRVHMEKLSAPLVIEADTAEVKDNELVVTLGDAIVARVPEKSVRSWWIEDNPPN